MYELASLYAWYRLPFSYLYLVIDVDNVVVSVDAPVE